MSKKKKKQAESKQNQLVSLWLERIATAKKHWKDPFAQMRADMQFAKGIQQDDPEEHYTANFTLNHVQKKTAFLYAKNPKIRAERRQKMIFAQWGGDLAEIAEAKQALQMIQQEIGADPEAAYDIKLATRMQEVQSLIDDYEQGKAHMEMLEKIGKTLESLFHYFLNETFPRFKIAAKQGIRRAITTGVC